MAHERNIYLEDIPLDEARLRLETALRQIGRWETLPGEVVPLTEALGRVTAEPVWAKISSPHYHAAAMDGYAARASDTHAATETRPVKLNLTAPPLSTGQETSPLNPLSAHGEGTSRRADSPSPSTERGPGGEVDRVAYPVDTGDPLPPNTNAVIMIEDVQIVDDGILIRAPVAPWQHVRLMGEDMVVTEMVLPANHVLRPVDLGAIAGCGHHTVRVRCKPLVVIVPTGDELIPPGQPPQPGQIIEYNSLVLAGQIDNAGGRSQVTGSVPDDPDSLRQAISAALEQRPDLILVLSGSSAGSEDFTASIIRQMGQLLVHGVAVRPGHPVIMGTVGPHPPTPSPKWGVEGNEAGGRDIPIIGVPGYPVSAALTGELFVLPLLARWLGVQPLHDTLPRAQATATHKLVSPVGDDDFVRVTVAQVGERLLATPLSRGAGVITSLVRADGLARIPRFSEGIDIGSSVEVLLYRSLESIRQSVLMMGSHDPMIDLLGQFLSERLPGSRLVSSHVGSMGGLVALRRGETHLAGIHLLDPDSGTFNWPYVRKYLPDTPVQLVTFAHREQGLIVARGNPLAIRSIDDLPRLRYVNRQRGAGTRVLLDYELQKRGITPESIAGYDHEEYTHLGVAAAVASGIADCGLGVRSGAVALELDFVPVSWERYDIVVPDNHRTHPAVAALLEVLNTEAFRQALHAQPGYDTRETGSPSLNNSLVIS
jgi:putative molybdopterin biosynthesis protein